MALISASQATISRALPARGGRWYAKVHPRFSWAIGKPTRSIQCASLDPAGGVWKPAWKCNASDYKVPQHGSFLRPFSNGVVLVNPANTSDADVPLGGRFFDPAQPEAPAISKLTVGANTGRILLAKLKLDDSAAQVLDGAAPTRPAWLWERLNTFIRTSNTSGACGRSHHRQLRHGYR